MLFGDRLFPIDTWEKISFMILAFLDITTFTFYYRFHLLQVSTLVTLCPVTDRPKQT